MRKYRVSKIVVIVIIFVVVVFKVSPPVLIRHINNAEQIEIELTILEKQLNQANSSVVHVYETEENISRLKKRAAGLKSQVGSRKLMQLWFYTLAFCLLMIGVVIDLVIELRRVKNISLANRVGRDL